MNHTLEYIRKVFWIACSTLLVFQVQFAFGQSGSPEQGILYKYEASVGGAIHTNGWWLSYRKAKNPNALVQRYWEIGLSALKHPKEVKRTSIYQNSGGRNYAFGKLHNFATLQFAVGRVKPWVNKDHSDHIGVNYFYAAGLSMGMLKPVYLEVVNFEETPITVEVQKYDPDLHTVDRIVGKGPFTRGIDEIQFRPGLMLKGGFQFTYNNRLDQVKQLEVGAAIDYYFTEVPVMAFATNKPYFLSLFVAFNWGYKSN